MTAPFLNKIRKILDTQVNTNAIIEYCIFGGVLNGFSSNRQVIDIDIAILVDSFCPKISTQLKLIQKKIEKKFSDEFEVIFGFYYGPYKPHDTFKRPILFFHINLHTKITYLKRHVFFKWSVAQYLKKGNKRFIKLSYSQRPEIKDLFDLEQKSISHFLSCVNSEEFSIPFRNFEDLSTLNTKTVNYGMDYLECLFFSSLMAARNHATVLGIDAEKYYSIKDFYKKYLSEVVYSNNFETILNFKFNYYENNKKINIKIINKLTKDWLYELQDHLKGGYEYEQISDPLWPPSSRKDDSRAVPLKDNGIWVCT